MPRFLVEGVATVKLLGDIRERIVCGLVILHGGAWYRLRQWMVRTLLGPVTAVLLVAVVCGVPASLGAILADKAGFWVGTFVGLAFWCYFMIMPNLRETTKEHLWETFVHTVTFVSCWFLAECLFIAAAFDRPHSSPRQTFVTITVLACILWLAKYISDHLDP